MASGESGFPAQQQERQPGKEHLMDPLPQFLHPGYKPAGKLAGKVALVTGGDSGIGRAVSLLFALEGAAVAFTYLKGEEDRDAKHTLSMLREAMGELSRVRKAFGIAGGGTDEYKEPVAIPVGDLCFEEACKDAVESVVSHFGGGIDILVNNAAESYLTRGLDDITGEHLDRVFGTNAYSYFFMAKHAVKHMKAGASIVNTASVDAYRGNAQFLGYAATKGAVVAFTRSLAMQLVGEKIRVNGVAPGPVWTPLIPATNPPDAVASFGKDAPMGRAAQPCEIAPCYVFLASDDSCYMTGQMLHPNGGAVVGG